MDEQRTFVVRIYRTGESTVDGVVESVATGALTSFHSSADLWAIVSRPPECSRVSSKREPEEEEP